MGADSDIAYPNYSKAQNGEPNQPLRQSGFYSRHVHGAGYYGDWERDDREDTRRTVDKLPNLHFGTPKYVQPRQDGSSRSNSEHNTEY
jgi:hypothetical protein